MSPLARQGWTCIQGNFPFTAGFDLSSQPGLHGEKTEKIGWVRNTHGRNFPCAKNIEYACYTRMKKVLRKRKFAASY